MRFCFAAPHLGQQGQARGRGIAPRHNAGNVGLGDQQLPGQCLGRRTQLLLGIVLHRSLVDKAGGGGGEAADFDRMVIEGHARRRAGKRLDGPHWQIAVAHQKQRMHNAAVMLA